MSANKKNAAALGRKDLLPRLKQELRTKQCLSRESMTGIAAETGLPLNDVYAVSTFYSFLPVRPVGKNIIRICQCVPCDMGGAPAVMESIQKALGVGPGETTADGKFTFEIVNCIGACDQAPAMMVNDDLHGRLDPAKVADILKSY